MFYYGLVVHGSAAKTNLQKTETVKWRFIRATFLKTRLKTLVNVVSYHRIRNVSELFIMEIIHELFKEIRNESSLKLIDINISTHKSLVTSWTSRSPIDIPYSRTVVKRRSLANTMIRAYNFFMDLKLIPDDPGNLTKNQMSFYITNVISVYIMDNKDAMSIYFYFLTVIVHTHDQRGSNRRALLLILRPHWIIACRVYHVCLAISVYMYLHSRKLTASVSVSNEYNRKKKCGTFGMKLTEALLERKAIKKSSFWYSFHKFDKKSCDEKDASI